jgi:hypothetical protein
MHDTVHVDGKYVNNCGGGGARAEAKSRDHDGQRNREKYIQSANFLDPRHPGVPAGHWSGDRFTTRD